MRQRHLASALVAALCVALCCAGTPALAGSVDRGGGSGSDDLQMRSTSPVRIVPGGPSVQGGLEVVWDNGAPIGGALASQCAAVEGQETDCNDLACDNFATAADDFLLENGAVVRAMRVFNVTGGGDPPNEYFGWIVTFYGGAFDSLGGEPIPDEDNILNCFITTADAYVAGEPGTTWEYLIEFEGGDAHIGNGLVQWVSAVPIVDLGPQIFWSQSDQFLLSQCALRFIPTDPEFHDVCEPDVFDLCPFNGYAFKLEGEGANGGSNVVSLLCPDGGTNCTGQGGCTIRLTPTLEPLSVCNGGDCPPSFGASCFAEINASGLPATLAAQFLAISLQNAIDGNQCGVDTLLSVESIGPRIILTTSDGPKPIPCLTVPGYTGILGGFNACETDGCGFHFQSGLGDDDVLPSIGRGTDRLATVKDCATNPGLGTWTTFDFPAGFFDRTGDDEFSSKEMLGVQIPFSGVARNFAVDDSDTFVERLGEVVFGRCSGDFTRPDGPANQRSPDGIVDELDQAAFEACLANPIGDCNFFDYDGDGDIDENDQFVFECLLFTGNNTQCCPPNRNLPQVASNIPTTSVTRLHLRACDPIEVARDGQNDWPEEWTMDVYLSEVTARVRSGDLGPCEAGDNEPNNVIAEAEDLGILAVGEPQQIAGSISSTTCDPFLPPPAFAGSFDADVYRFSVAFADRVNANIAAASDTTGCAGGPFGIHALYLYDADGGLVASDKGGFVGKGKEEEQIDPSISVNVPPGEYFLVVAAAGQVRDPDPTDPMCSVVPPGQPFDGSRDPTGDYELNLSIAIRGTINVLQEIFDEGTGYGAGSFNSRLLVQPLLAFSKVCDPFHAILVDSGNLEDDAVILEAQGVSWVNELIGENVAGVIIPGDPNFVPGVGGEANAQEPEEIQHVDPSGGEYMHRVEPPRATKCETVEGNCFYRHFPDDDQTLESVSALVNPLQRFPVADNFMLDQNTEIGSITIWTTPAGAVTSEDVFLVQVLGDGPLSGGCNGPDDSNVLTDGVVGVPLVSPSAFLDMDRVTLNVAPFTATAGTKYWVVLAWNSDESPSGTQPLFATSLEGDGEYFLDLNPGSVGTGEDCINAPNGNGWDCDATADNPLTNCDETTPNGDRKDDGDIAMCLGPALEATTKELPWDVACGQWRSMEGQIAWTQPFAVRSDGFVGTFSDLNVAGTVGGRQAADSVTFFEDVSVTDIHWRGGYTSNTPDAFDRFRIEFYQDQNDLPDFGVDFFFQPNPINLGRVAGGLTGDPGRQIYDFWFTFPAPVEFLSEETVWISILNDTTGETYQWFYGFAQGGDSDGRAADRDIDDGQGGPGAWSASGPPSDAPTDYSFDLTVKGSTKIMCGDSVDCDVAGIESTASGLGYYFDSEFCYISGFQSKGEADVQNRYRVVKAPWKFLDEFAVTQVPPDQAGSAFAEAGIDITPEEVECLIQNVPGTKLVLQVFEGLADYLADIEVNGVQVTGTIDRLCNGALIERLDPNEALSERLSVKGICWDNNTVTFLTHPVAEGECVNPPTPQIVHGSGPGALTTPCTGYVDPRLEVEASPPNAFIGLQEVLIKFNTEVYKSDGVSDVDTSNFSLSVCLGGATPVVDEVSYVGGNKSYVRVHWDNEIALKHWTTLIADVSNCAGVPIENDGDLGPKMQEPDRMDYAALPGDIDQFGSTQILDLLRFRQFILGTCVIGCPDCGGDALYFDTDHNAIPGQVLDFLRFRQILLGSPPATEVWLGQVLLCPQP